MVVESDWSETSTQGGQLYEIALDRALGFPGAENNLNAIIHDIVLLVTVRPTSYKLVCILILEFVVTPQSETVSQIGR